MDLELI